MPRRFRSLALVTILGIVNPLGATPVQAPPDSQFNDVTGVIETADTPWSGTNYRVRHVINGSPGHTVKVVMLTPDGVNSLGGRLVINTLNGDSWVAWWRDAATDQVIVRKRNNATGAWSAERVQSLSSVGSRRPSVAFADGHAWIAYESDATAGVTRLEAKVIEDDPSPFLAGTVVATTAYTGEVDALLQSESGRLWLSWVDSATQVGWCRYNAGTGFWTTSAFESYASDTVPEARERIRATVLAN